MGVLRRREGGNDRPAVSDPSEPDAWAVRYPGLWEFLTAERWPDETVRRTGTLLLFWDQGLIKGCLSDREQGLVAFSSAGGVEALLEALEHDLQHDRLDWRAAKAGPPKRRR